MQTRNASTVGFTGHRKLAEPEKIKALIKAELSALVKESAGRLTAVSSIACGADTLFAEACLELGIPWELLFPMPPGMFFNDRDFTAEEIQRAEKCRAQAVKEEILFLPQDGEEAGNSAWRQTAFRETGIRTVDKAAIVLAVWRTNETALKRGGTGEMVQYARGIHRPLVVIDADTLQVSREGSGA